MCPADPGLSGGPAPASPPRPTPISCAGSVACFAAWPATSVCARVGSPVELHLGPRPGDPKPPPCSAPPPSPAYSGDTRPRLGGPGVLASRLEAREGQWVPSGLRAQAWKGSGAHRAGWVIHPEGPGDPGEGGQRVQPSRSPSAQPHDGVCREAPVCSAPAPSLRPDPQVLRQLCRLPSTPTLASCRAWAPHSFCATATWRHLPHAQVS